MASVLKHAYILSIVESDDLPISDVRGAGFFNHKNCYNAFVRKYKAELAKQLGTDDFASPHPDDEFFEAIDFRTVANYMSESTSNSLSTIKFKALEMEKNA